MEFFKYSGLGNDFIIIDNMNEKLSFEKDDIKKMCHRNFGIGADGVVLICKSQIADVKMVIFNSDGSRAGMCGNASRCFAKYVYEKKIIQKENIIVETDSGIIIAELKVNNEIVESIKVNMGKPILEPFEIPCTINSNPIVNYEISIDNNIIKITALKMGVPHAVVFTENIKDDNVIQLGKLIENSIYFPQKTNVNFVHIKSRYEIELRTWERGAGYTYACGTGACSSVVAGILNGLLDDKVKVQLRGGNLQVSWPQHENVYMEGPAEEIFKGFYNL